MTTWIQFEVWWKAGYPYEKLKGDSAFDNWIVDMWLDTQPLYIQNKFYKLKDKIFDSF